MKLCVQDLGLGLRAFPNEDSNMALFSVFVCYVRVGVKV